MSATPPATPRAKRERPEDPIAEIFASPAQRRAGLLNIATSPLKADRQMKAPSSPNITRPRDHTQPIILPPDQHEIGLKPSAIKRGIINIDPNSGRISPLRGSPGRSRSHYDFTNRLAIRRALVATNPGLAPQDEDIQDLDEDDLAIAERIIGESNRANGSSSPTRTPRNRKLMALDEDAADDMVFEPLEGNSFRATPCPTPIQEEKIISKFGRTHRLLEASQTLFVDGPEGFFEQHKFKGKTSGNTMAQAPSLDYSEFVQLSKISDFLQLPHRDNLMESYQSNFPQWHFELSQGFNVCLYGVGSKLHLLSQFVDTYLTDALSVPVLVANGYNPATTLREVVEQTIKIVLPSRKLKNGKSQPILKLPAAPHESVPLLVRYLEKSNDKSLKIVLAIHNLDGPAFKGDRAQSALAQLSGLPQVWLVTSVDKINAPILWDSAKTSQFNFAWHDTTTYDNYNVENGFEDLLHVGRSSKNIGTKGAQYVLSSLTQNARNLYRVLVANQLQALEEEADDKASDRSLLVGSVRNGIEFKLLYNLCVEEFIASNEISFRIMLREFIEHDMAGLSKNSAGTEIVFVPLTIDELEQLLTEELLE
ncbi:origin recognition complex subunit 2 [Saccharomycopsis crataegensis]|uniref:Origin recognition complex subunit 2 n=1 Tax=Saccharomycopsis crataegensis TaxID=43959 RepID=A0AAV5QIK3_9ASCO|nr:origin recognition complex subunit 2 [Saccharomycopsis crataegensis]